MAWRSWDKICYPKKQGGLRFKKAKDINNALLAKLTQMIATKRDSLCMNILRAKYKVSNNQLHSDPPKRASPIWRAIEQAKKVVVKGACYAIGDGTSINIQEDPWVPWTQGFILTPKGGLASHEPMFMNELIDPDLHCWKPNFVSQGQFFF